MDELLNNLRDIKRHLNSIEHTIYVSCKFTRTTEMLKKVMESIVFGYEQFFGISYQMFLSEEQVLNTVFDKIQVLKQGFETQGIDVDMSDYFLLKRLLISDFERIGEYRKNLCMVSYIDGEEFTINISRLIDFYHNLRDVVNSLNSIQIVS